METCAKDEDRLTNQLHPYSLGILTEWKLNCWFRRLSFPASTASYRAIPLGFWSLTTDKEIWRSL